MSVLFEPSTTSLAAREYVLLVSGTMNPPHIGHVRLGLRAADALRKEGHRVRAICYLPVHDNYLVNKIALKKEGGREISAADEFAVPLRERCEMLKSLIAAEDFAAQENACHVLDYEHSADKGLLAESPGYWATRLPQGYLRTVPTTALIAHFAVNSPLLADGSARLAVVFGVDNLAGMSSWNAPETLLQKADLVLLARCMSSVQFGSDPSGLLGAVKHLEVRAAVPVKHAGAELFGAACGSFVNAAAAGEGALMLLPPLEGPDESLSSTAIRNAVGASAPAAASDDAAATCAATLAQHGYTSAAMQAQMAESSAGSAAALRAMHEAGVQRGDWIEPKVLPKALPKAAAMASGTKRARDNAS